MRTRQSKRGDEPDDSLVQKLDFNDNDDALDVSETRASGVGIPTLIPKCPLCSCNEHGGMPADCSCGSCLSIYAAESNELRDDFCHRDRPRFVFWKGKGTRGRTKNGGLEVEPLKTNSWILQTCVLLFFILIIIFLLVCIKWILIDGFGNLVYLWVNFEDFSDYGTAWVLEKHWVLGPVSVGLLAFLIGASCTCLSWNITYYDSMKPGILPPTPLSPIKQRSRSRSVFHLGYILALANGLAAFTVAWWWLQPVDGH